MYMLCIELLAIACHYMKEITSSHFLVLLSSSTNHTNFVVASIGPEYGGVTSTLAVILPSSRGGGIENRLHIVYCSGGRYENNFK